MLNPLTLFRNLGLRNKLLISYAVVLIISIGIGGYISYKYAVSLIEKDFEEQLRNTTRSITQLVKTAAAVSTRNYLLGIIERNIELLHDINNNTSRIDSSSRIDAARSLLNQKIGQDGFIYCIDSEGNLVATPKILKDPDQYARLPIQITRREGYYEYRDNDNNQLISRPKADYSKIFKPWEWTIVVSAFRDELNQLVQIDDFKHIVLSHQFGKTGHSYILDTNGNLIIHPSKQGHNLINLLDEKKQFYINEICRIKNGQFIHHSKDATTKQVKESLVVFNYIPELDWIVVSESCLEEFSAPLKAVQLLIITTVCVFIIFMLPISYWLSASITNPINDLMNRFEIGIKGDLSVRIKKRSTDEIGLLANYFNSFMDKLENYKRSLQNEMTERSQLEREILKISEEERYRIGQDLHDDLCPHLIGIEALCKVLVKKLSTKTLTESAQAEIVRSLVAESISKTRNLSKGLCPVDIGNAALESSLLDLVQYAKNVLGIDCRFIKVGPSVRFNQAKATNLYYIARESVLNAVKHSQATQIKLKLDTSDFQISLVIEDNGRGFKNTSKGRGVGLGIMKYRAHVIGGKIDIVSKQNQGSKVICKIRAKMN